MTLDPVSFYVDVGVLSRNRTRAMPRRAEMHARRLRRDAAYLAGRELHLWLESIRDGPPDVLAHLRGLLDPRTPKHVHYVCYVPRLMDDDNLDLKPYRDGLVRAGFLDDDGPRTGHHFDPPVQIRSRTRHGVTVAVRLKGGEPAPSPFAAVHAHA